MDCRITQARMDGTGCATENCLLPSGTLAASAGSKEVCFVAEALAQNVCPVTITLAA